MQVIFLYNLFILTKIVFAKGTVDEAKKILDLGLYIGINGCSLKTKENIEAMKTIPTHKLVLFLLLKKS